MRLYRGLKTPYKSEFISEDGANFTNCPEAALSFARGTKGELLVADIPETNERGLQIAQPALWGIEDKPEQQRLLAVFKKRPKMVVIA